MLRPLHPGVDVTLDELIQRQRPAGGQQCPDQQMRDAAVIRWSCERDDISDQRGGEDHEKNARLGERHEVAGHLSPIARGRGDNHLDGWRAHRPTTYTTVNTTTHTPSTKCQYQETSSTRVAWTTLSAPDHAKTRQRLSMTSPRITCDACRPTSG